MFLVCPKASRSANANTLATWSEQVTTLGGPLAGTQPIEKFFSKQYLGGPSGCLHPGISMGWVLARGPPTHAVRSIAKGPVSIHRMAGARRLMFLWGVAAGGAVLLARTQNQIAPKSGPQGRFPARRHYCVT